MFRHMDVPGLEALPVGGTDLGELGRFLTALGDPVRQRIVLLLSADRLNVGDLADRVRLSPPAVSHHLKVLSDAGVLAQDRAGRERLYRVNATRCQELAERLRQFVASCCKPGCC
jgi:DNA-binding transcriptional ArsR family regulator